MSIRNNLLLAALMLSLTAYAPSVLAQAATGNPFARPAPKPATPAPAAPAAAPVPAAPPVPAIPASLLGNEDNLREAFSDFTLVASADNHAVLRAGETSYYLRNGDSFDYDGTKLRVKIEGGKVRLLTQKDADEVFSAELGTAMGPVSSGRTEVTDNKAVPGVKK